jgi:hypothetical protein
MFHRRRRRRELVSRIDVTRPNLTDFDRNGRELQPRSNEPSADARWWIVVAMEIQYGGDAPSTEFARALWSDSVAKTQHTEPL